MLIGINYFNQKGQLRGCINDVKNMSTYLHENFGYPRENMVLLTDDQQNPKSQPTKANILRAMHWLVKDAKPNDSLFFHYSGKSVMNLLLFNLSLTGTGHGGQTPDLARKPSFREIHLKLTGYLKASAEGKVSSAATKVSWPRLTNVKG